MPQALSNCCVWRVSSASSTSASRSTSAARGLRSRRLPIGVATTNSVPAGGVPIESAASRVTGASSGPPHAARSPSRPASSLADRGGRWRRCCSSRGRATGALAQRGSAADEAAVLCAQRAARRGCATLRTGGQARIPELGRPPRAAGGARVRGSAASTTTRNACSARPRAARAATMRCCWPASKPKSRWRATIRERALAAIHTLPEPYAGAAWRAELLRAAGDRRSSRPVGRSRAFAATRNAVASSARRTRARQTNGKWPTRSRSIQRRRTRRRRATESERALARTRPTPGGGAGRGSASRRAAVGGVADAPSRPPGRGLPAAARAPRPPHRARPGWFQVTRHRSSPCCCRFRAGSKRSERPCATVPWPPAFVSPREARPTIKVYDTAAGAAAAYQRAVSDGSSVVIGPLTQGRRRCGRRATAGRADAGPEFDGRRQRRRLSCSSFRSIRNRKRAPSRGASLPTGWCAAIALFPRSAWGQRLEAAFVAELQATGTTDPDVVAVLRTGREGFLRLAARRARPLRRRGRPSARTGASRRRGATRSLRRVRVRSSPSWRPRRKLRVRCGRSCASR